MSEKCNKTDSKRHKLESWDVIFAKNFPDNFDKNLIIDLLGKSYQDLDKRWETQWTYYYKRIEGENLSRYVELSFFDYSRKSKWLRLTPTLRALEIKSYISSGELKVRLDSDLFSKRYKLGNWDVVFSNEFSENFPEYLDKNKIIEALGKSYGDSDEMWCRHWSNHVKGFRDGKPPPRLENYDHYVDLSYIEYDKKSKLLQMGATIRVFNKNRRRQLYQWAGKLKVSI